MDKKISVIMPAFNLKRRGNLFQAAVDSIINQSFQNWELIIIADGENKDTFEKMLAESKKDKRIKLFYIAKNIGPASVRNHGFLKSNGNFITFHDTDDYSSPDRFEKLINLIGNTNVVASYVKIENLQSKDPLTAGRIKHYLGWNYDLFINYRKIRAPIHMSSALMSRDFFIKMGGFENYRVASDSIFVIKLGLVLGLTKSAPIPIFQEPLYTWNRHAYSITTSNADLQKRCLSAQRKPLIKVHDAIHDGLPDVVDDGWVFNLIGIKNNIISKFKVHSLDAV